MYSLFLLSLFVFGVLLLFLPPLTLTHPFLCRPVSVGTDTLCACLFLHCIYFPFLYETWRCLALFFTVMMAPAEQSVPGWLNCVFNKTMMSNWAFVATPVWLGADCLLCIARQVGENTLIKHCLNYIPITRPPVHLSEWPKCPALCTSVSPKSQCHEVSYICISMAVLEHTWAS